ncbi:3-keto-5-aminohexanoate cleavage protein [Massilia putida]|uniref:3-keto-5-aminohexanoate cleavage protein n=1 Tax=Massilia putida TaxID=1141883 RepID=UPI0009517A23|nr:3-keto-5-aminohexanoate cleavage protein [Massilia putida]
MSSIRQDSEAPVVIEAAVTPLRKGAPLQPAQATVSEATECLAAGAAIIHYHHDFRLERSAATGQIIDIGKAILADFPHALYYPDYIAGRDEDRALGRRYQPDALLRPMHDAGALRMFALDPGFTLFGQLDDKGLPSNSVTGGQTYAEAHAMVEYAREVDCPISIGIYEPGNLRWVVAYAKAGMFPSGSLIKIYFGGEYTMGQDRVPGVNFGLAPTRANLDVYLGMMQGIDLPWQVSVQGGVLLDTEVARHALELGGHLRVGVEDTAGGTPMSNRETVEAAVALARQVGRPVATGEAALAALARPPFALAA